MAILSCVLGLALMIGATKVNATSPTTFEMLGMSIRYDSAAGEDGIRFGVKLDKATYNALIADNNAVAGILVTPTDQISAAPLSLANATANKASNGVLFNGATGANYWTVGDDYATGIVYLHGFPEASYNRPITAIAYIDWDGDGSDANYSDSVAVSMADVALAVVNDYQGSNTYGTTAAQATKLDAYLLNYTVDFLDAYGNVASTQNVKFGAELTVASDPVQRTGYTFNGWYKKNGGDTYATTATDFTAANAKLVKYATTFKPGFATSGSTFEKPAMDCRINQTPTTFTVTNTAATMSINTNKNVTAFFTDVELAQNQNFVIYADVNSGFADQIGFVAGTNTANNKHLLFQWRANDIYLWRDISWTGHEDNKWTPGYGNKNSNVSIAMVYKDGFYYMFLNGAKKATIDETANTGWGMVPKNAIGTDGTKKIGLSFFNGSMVCTDWGYSTDAAVISQYVPDTLSLGTNIYDKAGGTVTGSTLSAPTDKVAAALLPNAEFAKTQNYVVSVRAESTDLTATEYGFIIGKFDGTSTPPNLYHVLFRWTNQRKFVADRQANGSDWGWNGECHIDKSGTISAYGASTITLIHCGGKYYMQVDGVEVMKSVTVDGYETLPIDWGGNFNFAKSYCEDDSVPTKIGVCVYGGTATFTDYVYSTDEDVIAGYLKEHKNPAMDSRINQTPTTFNVTSTSATMGINTNKTVTAFFTDVEIAQDQSFVIYADVNNGFADNIGFVVGTNTANNKHLLFHWRSNDIYLWRETSWTGHEDNKWTPGYGNKNSNVKIAMVYKNGYYYMFFNGVQKAKIDETANTGWGMVPKNAIGTDGTKKIGLYFFNGNMNCTAWGYSTDADFINANYPVN